MTWGSHIVTTSAARTTRCSGCGPSSAGATSSKVPSWALRLQTVPVVPGYRPGCLPLEHGGGKKAPAQVSVVATAKEPVVGGLECGCDGTQWGKTTSLEVVCVCVVRLKHSRTLQGDGIPGPAYSERV